MLTAVIEAISDSFQNSVSNQVLFKLKNLKQGIRFYIQDILKNVKLWGQKTL